MKKRTKVFITMLMMVFVLGFTVNAESFRLSKDDVTLNTGDIMLIETYGTDVVPVWTSSNAKVAQVNAKGQVTALKAGKTEVTADVNGESKTCSVKVVNSSIKLNKTDAVIYTGKNPTTLKLKANVKGLSKDVTYKSNR